MTTVGSDTNMHSKQIREENLRGLVVLAGSQTAVAKKADTDPAYLSQILGDKAKRYIGDALARRLERAFDKPEGWMDHINP